MLIRASTGRMAIPSLLLAAAVLTISGSVLGSSVSTTSGHLTGLRVRKNGATISGTVYQFLGVPYAEPPLGDLRFQPPRELDASSANEHRFAQTFGAVCYQPPHLKEFLSPLLNRQVRYSSMSEDCLFLNVYVPKVTASGPLPVMVWIAGEGFDFADARHFDPSYLALAGKVIVVTMNYRVSAFGFLSGQVESAPGNVGLWDQVAALRWVKKNVANFGGDPENVTLFGRFTGAMSISMLVTSPSVEDGLFHKVIMQSGLATGNWVFDADPVNATLTLAKEAGCLRPAMDDVIACLRALPSADLYNKTWAVPQRWRPVVDGHLVREEPLDALRGGRFARVNYLLGYNSDEGSLCLVNQQYAKTPLYHKLLQDQVTVDDFRSLISGDLQMYLRRNDPCLLDAVYDRYGHRNNSGSFRADYVRACSSMLVSSHMELMARLLASLSDHKVYVYEFDHRPSFSIHAPFIRAGHGDDVLFAFGLLQQLPSPRSDELALSNALMAAFTNFARTGGPNPSVTPLWRPFQSGHPAVMHLSTEMSEQSLQPSKQGADIQFWHDIIPALESQEDCSTVPQLKSLSVRVVRAYAQLPQSNESPNTRESSSGAPLSHHVTEMIIVGVVCSVVVVASVLIFSAVRMTTTSRRLLNRNRESLLVRS